MKLIITIILSVTTLFAQAQSKDLDKANEYFNEFNYKKAIKQYSSLLKDGKHAYYATSQIAKSYSKLGNSREAASWYKKVIDFPEVDFNTYFLLAKELQKLKEYEEAQLYLEKYYAETDVNSQHQITNLKSFIESLKVDSLRYQVNHLAFNTQYDEFGPVFYQDQIVFSSNRPSSGISKNKDIRTGASFYNLYQIKETSIESRKAVTPFSNNINSIFNDGPVCFESDFSTMYLTRNTESKDGSVSVLNLFIGIKEGKDWSKKLQPMNLYTGNYNVAHAYLDTKNRLVYFSSDMPGGFGGMDLYVSRIKDGFLSKPTNLGPNINTIGNEIFPFVSANGVLYFTSDGQPGMGGYDLFFSKSKEGEFSRAFNLGYPVNTASDDFSLALDNTNTYGYFTSNRSGGNGGDDIYSVVIKEQIDYCLVKGTLSNASNETPLSEAWVDISSNNGKFKTRLTTDENGEFSIYLKTGSSYTLLCRKKLFQNAINTITSEMINSSDELEINISLTEK